MLKLAYFSPLTPQPSGIADYSEALLPHLAAHAEIDLFVDGFIPTNEEMTSRFRILDYKASPKVLKGLSDYDAAIYHMGNDHRYHAGIYRVARQHPGIVVLHDFALQHFFWGLAETEKDLDIYLDEIEAESGPAERRLTEQFLSEHGSPTQLSSATEHPLNFGLVSGSLAMIVHSEWARKRLQKVAGETPVYMIPHLVFGHRDKVPLGSEDKTGRVKIASFGRVTADKGIERALRVLAKLRDRFEFEYTLVGEVCEYFPLESIIRELGIQDLIRIVGHTDIEEFVSQISSTDIAINLREQTVGETSGSLCRIMAAGVAPIVSDVAWFSELPDDCVVKIDMTTCTDDMLEAYLTRLIEDPGLRAQIGSNARKYVLDNFRLEDCVAKYVHAIEQTVGERVKRKFVSHLVGQVAELKICDHGSEALLPSIGREITMLNTLPKESKVVPQRNQHVSNGKALAAVAAREHSSRIVSIPVRSGKPEEAGQNEQRLGRTPLVEGLDYERGALDYVRQLDDEHRYYLRTKPFFNLAGKPPKDFLDLDERPPKYEGDGLDVESHRHICDFANLVASLALPAGSRILDVGCGSGWLSEWFARFGYDVTGVDISPDLVEMSRKRLDGLSYGADHETGLRCRFEVLNIGREALDEQFDAVICYDSLHHFINEHLAMRNLARMTRSGGTLFILEGDKPSDDSAAASELRRVMEKTATLESPFDPAYLRELVVENGFAVVGDYVSVNGLYPRESLEGGNRLPVEVEPVNYLLCKKVGDGSIAQNITDSRKPNVLSATLTVLETQMRTAQGDLVKWGSDVRAGSEFLIPLEIQNTGDTIWLAGAGSEPGIVQVGVKLFNARGEQVSEEHGLPPFPQAVVPGESRKLIVRHPAPDTPGTYTLKIDLVAEHVAWFEEHGSNVLNPELKVI